MDTQRAALLTRVYRPENRVTLKILKINAFDIYNISWADIFVKKKVYFFDAPYWTRTNDTRINSPLL